MYEDLIFRRIFDRLRRLNREKLSRSIGLVTDDSPLTVEIGGEEIVGIEKINYSPTIGDRVWVSRSHGDMVVHGEIGSSGGGGGGYSPPIPQSEVTSLVSDLASKQPLDSDLTAIAALSTTAFGRALLELADAAALRTAGALAGTGVSNTFTQPQTVDLGATGTAFTLDVHTGGSEKWLNFTEGGAARGQISEFGNQVYVDGASGLILAASAGDVVLAPNGNTSANSKKITSLADATTGTDALNRQTGDARYFLATETELAALAGLTSAADRLPYFTGSGAASLATFTAAGRALVDDADAAAQRTTLGLVIGTNVQAYDAELTDVANIEDEWTLVHDFGVKNLPLDASTTERAFAANTAQVQAAASFATGTAPAACRLNSANFPSFTGKTLKLRLRVWAAVNGTDPNADVDFKLKPITIGGGTDALTATFGAQAGNTAQVTNAALATNEHEEATSTSFNFPSADLYVCTVTLSATLANNSAMWVGAKLERRWE